MWKGVMVRRSFWKYYAGNGALLCVIVAGLVWFGWWLVNGAGWKAVVPARFDNVTEVRQLNATTYRVKFAPIVRVVPTEAGTGSTVIMTSGGGSKFVASKTDPVVRDVAPGGVQYVEVLPRPDDRYHSLVRIHVRPDCKILDVWGR